MPHQQRMYIAIRGYTECNCMGDYSMIPAKGDQLYNYIMEYADGDFISLNYNLIKGKDVDTEKKKIRDFVDNLKKITTVHKCLTKPISCPNKAQCWKPANGNPTSAYSIHMNDVRYQLRVGRMTYWIYIVDNPDTSKFKICLSDECMCFDDYPFRITRKQHKNI
jgi:hypothetical protein